MVQSVTNSMELIGQYSDYRRYLGDVLEHRCRSNAHYSLRAFARDLAINPPRLSEVLNHKKGLSLGAAATLSEKLGFSEAETDYFCDLVQAADARTASARRLATIRLKRYQNQDRFELSTDVTAVIADWYHFAILELIDTEDFSADTNWIASALKISPAVAKAAVERLVRVGLIKNTAGRFVRGTDAITTSHDVPSAAVRQLTQSMLNKAGQALENQSVDIRDYSTITMAIDPDKLPEAKKRITVFRRELAQFLESGRKTKVYTLAVQLFSLQD